MLPLLIEPAGQCVVTRQGARGLLVGYAGDRHHVAYRIITEDGEAVVARATDVDLEINSDQRGEK